MTLDTAILITRLDYYFEAFSMFPFHFLIKKNALIIIDFGSERKEHILPMLLLVKNTLLENSKQNHFDSLQV